MLLVPKKFNPKIRQVLKDLLKKNIVYGLSLKLHPIKLKEPPFKYNLQ